MPGMVVDIDGTILDRREIDRIAMERLLGKYSGDPVMDWSVAIEKMGTERVSEVWHKVCIEIDPEPIPGSAEALSFLSDQGYDIFYLTSRNNHSFDGTTVFDETKRWLERNGFPPGNLYVVGWHKCGDTKNEALNEIVTKVKKPIYGIGDKKSDITTYITRGIIPILFHNPEYHLLHEDESKINWDGIIRISDWNDLIELMRNKPSVDFVVGGFIARNNRVLLVKHKQIGKWVPPGGHIEQWESPDEAVIREMKEETGLDVEFVNKPTLEGELHRPDIVHRHNIHFAHDHIMFGYFLRAEGEFSGNDEGDWYWFTEDEIKKGEKDGAEIPEYVKEICLRRLELKD